jgi:YaiO family outer membrane protein
MFAPDNGIVAKQDVSGEVVQALPRGFGLGVGYRYLNFRDATVHMPQFIVNYEPSEKLRFGGRYSPAKTNFSNGAEVWNQSGSIRAAYDWNKYLTTNLAFGFGNGSFAGVSRDQVGNFDAQTYGIGAELRFNGRNGIRLSYYDQERSAGRREQGGTVSYFVNF